MNTRPTTEDEGNDPLAEALHVTMLVESKLRGLSQLFSNNGKCMCINTDEELKLIGYGTGQILSECADQLFSIRDKMDQAAADGTLFYDEKNAHPKME